MKAALLAAIPLLLAAAAALVGETAGTFSDQAQVGGNVFITDTLNPPTGLTATGGATITLNWTATADTYASGHRIFRSTTTGGPYGQIAQVTPRTTTTYEDNPASGTYYYVVRAYYQDWESANSNEASAASTGGSPMRLTTGTYTGNAADNRAITEVGFQPDVVFVKCTCGVSAVVRTSTMAGDTTKVIGTVTALQPDHVQSLDADGFTIGTSTRVNTNGNTYHWVAMKAGTDLYVGSYVGDGTDNRSITGVGFQPVWVLTMGDGDDSWIRPASVTGDISYPMDGLSQFTNRIQALEADGFQIGSNDNVNELGTTFHYIAWKASANVKQSTYVGDGTDNRSIAGVGSQPLMVWVKRDSTNQATWRPASVSGDLSLFWSGTAANSDRIQLLEPDGFQVGTDVQVNTTDTYYFIALKDGGP